MDSVFNHILGALSSMGMPYTAYPDMDACTLGVQLDSGRCFNLLLRGNDDAQDVSISAAAGVVTTRTRTRIAQALATQANNLIKCVTFSYQGDTVVVDHVADLEFSSDPEALIQKGLLRIICALEETQDLIATSRGRKRPKRPSKAVREVEGILDDLHFD